MASKELVKLEIFRAFKRFQDQGLGYISSQQLLTLVQVSPATLRRHLDDLVSSEQLLRIGKARSTRYSLAKAHPEPSISLPLSEARHEFPFPLSAQSQTLMANLSLPLAARKPITYQRSFVDEYRPNSSFLLNKELAETLAREGRLRGQQPAGTYARKVLEQLLIDLSWSSSRLEGNPYTLLATEELFKRGAEAEDPDATMLLNHKRAIEFLVDAVPEYGLTSGVIRNLHSLLMQDLLDDPKRLGAIRSKIVNFSDTVYIPTQIPSLLEEMLELVLERARQHKNPIETAFFLWCNLSYLQPFEDGNKRTSRLAANIPLLIYNCAPLSFLDLDPQSYAYAMMGVYERLDSSLAGDLFAWTYRRSIAKYKTILESLGTPNPFRLKYREQLSSAVQRVVREGQTFKSVCDVLKLPQEDLLEFKNLLQGELEILSVHNCARYRLTMSAVEEWIAHGRRM